MKIEYKFVTGEKVDIEVYGEIEEIMLELNNELKKHNIKETRRHNSFDSTEKYYKNNDSSADVYDIVLKDLNKDKLYSVIAKLKPEEQKLIST